MENETTILQNNEEQFLAKLPDPFKERIGKFDFEAAVDDFTAERPDGDYSMCELVGYAMCRMLGIDGGIVTKKIADVTEEDGIKALQEFNIVMRELGLEEIPMEEPTEE